MWPCCTSTGGIPPVEVQQGHIQVSLVAGLECLGGDAVVERELVLLEGGNDARPWSYNLLALVVADGECVSDGCLQRHAALHHRAIDLIRQPRHGLDAALSPRVGKAR